MAPFGAGKFACLTFFALPAAGNKCFNLYLR